MAYAPYRSRVLDYDSVYLNIKGKCMFSFNHVLNTSWEKQIDFNRKLMPLFLEKQFLLEIDLYITNKFAYMIDTVAGHPAVSRKEV